MLQNRPFLLYARADGDKKVTAPVRTGELVHFPVELYRERLLPTSDFNVDSYSRFGVALVEQLCARHGMIQIPV
jgi:hypothetical protein